MHLGHSRIKLQDLPRVLKSYVAKRKIIFFTGAGISCPSPSNLPLGRDLCIEIIKGLISRSQGSKTFDNNIKINKKQILKKLLALRLENSLDVVVENTVHRQLFEIFNTKKFNEYHKLLAKISKKCGPTIIITTNFDMLIEEAMKSEKVKYTPICDEIGFIHFSKTLWNKRALERVIILKIHGSLDKMSTIKVTLKNVANKYISLSLFELLSRLFKKYNFIFTGYSALDDFDINPIISNISSNKKIFYIDHQEKLYKPKVLQLSYPFKCFKGYKIKIDTFSIMQNVAKELDIKLIRPKMKKKPSWKKILTNWLNKLDSLDSNVIIGISLYKVGDYYKSELFLKKALEIAKKKNNHRNIALVLNNLGSVYFQLGKYRRAKKHYEKALKLYKKIGKKPHDYLLIATNLSQIYLAERNLQKAFLFAKKSIKLSQRAKKAVVYKPAAYQNLALIYIQKNDFGLALKYCRYALKLAHKLGDANIMAQIYGTMGNIYYTLDNFESAYINYSQDLALSLKLFKNVRNHIALGQCFLHIGATLTELSKWEEARYYLKKALKISRKIKNCGLESQSLNNIGLLHYKMNRFTHAQNYFLASLRLKRKIKDRSGESQVLRNLGALYYSLGLLRKSESRYMRSYRIVKQINSLYEVAESNGGLGLVFLRQKNYGQALSNFRKALKIYKKLKCQAKTASTLNNIAVVYMRLKKWNKALETCKKCIVLKRSIGDREGMSVVLIKIASIFEESDNYGSAIDIYKSLIPLYKKRTSKSMIIYIYETLASVYRKIGQNRAANIYKRLVDKYRNQRKKKN